MKCVFVRKDVEGVGNTLSFPLSAIDRRLYSGALPDGRLFAVRFV